MWVSGEETSILKCWNFILFFSLTTIRNLTTSSGTKKEITTLILNYVIELKKNYLGSRKKLEQETLT